MQNETIAAISTPNGVGAVGIVRISGEKSKEILSRVWISSHTSVDKFESHRFYYGKLKALSTLDNVLAVFMKAPHSYTGEDVVEIHCHGGALSTKAVLNTILNSGARPASPGEFTKRAYLNGKMDLAQAEAVADVINATSERALKIAEEQLAGKLSKEILSLQDLLKKIKAFVEATIDFPEDDIEMIETEKISSQLLPVMAKLGKLSSSYSEGRIIKEGIKTVLVGKPNVGKSSLLNLLVGIDRAIVHHSPGTTRDTIEESVDINNVLFRLIDTAGLRETSCEVEKIGVDRTKDSILSADLVMVVLDASKKIEEDDLQILEETKNRKRIVILNKIDQGKNSGFNGEAVEASAKNGTGIEQLKRDMVRISSFYEGDAEGVTITSLRHKFSIDEAIKFLQLAQQSCSEKESSEFVAYHLQAAMEALGKITGEVATEDVLNEIFSNFCIGK